MFTSVARYSKRAQGSAFRQKLLFLGRSMRQEHWVAGLRSTEPLSDPQCRGCLSQAGVNLHEDSCLFHWLKQENDSSQEKSSIAPQGSQESLMSPSLLPLWVLLLRWSWKRVLGDEGKLHSGNNPPVAD